MTGPADPDADARTADQAGGSSDQGPEGSGRTSSVLSTRTLWRSRLARQTCRSRLASRSTTRHCANASNCRTLRKLASWVVCRTRISASRPRLCPARHRAVGAPDATNQIGVPPELPPAQPVAPQPAYHHPTTGSTTPGSAPARAPTYPRKEMNGPPDIGVPGRPRRSAARRWSRLWLMGHVKITLLTNTVSARSEAC